MLTTESAEVIFSRLAPNPMMMLPFQRYCLPFKCLSCQGLCARVPPLTSADTPPCSTPPKSRTQRPSRKRKENGNFTLRPGMLGSDKRPPHSSTILPQFFHIYAYICPEVNLSFPTFPENLSLACRDPSRRRIRVHTKIGQEPRCRQDNKRDAQARR